MLSALAHLGRMTRAAYVFAREGVLSSLDTSIMPPAAAFGVRIFRLIERRTPDARAVRISAALDRLGPSYVKLGQFLATRPDVVGAEVARDLESLQDRMPPFKGAEESVERALGRTIENAFTEFGPPVAAASIAQVHKAEIRSGGKLRPVAVKVLRPGVARRFNRDLQTFYTFAYQMERWSPLARRLRPVAVVDTLARSVAFEMDLRLEAAALSELAENTRDDPGFRVPAVDWERTAKDVLTLEWVDGIPLADHAGLAAAGHDLPALGRTLIQSFLRHAMRDGFFHADMHPGNLFVDAAGNIVAIDLGITGRLGPKERRFLAEILYGFIERDYLRVAQVHFQAGYVPLDQSVEDFARALRSIGEPIHDRTAEEISMARLLTQLFEVTELFDMKTRVELIMLQKTMVVVEGVARSLDPKLDLWKTADPVVREWITRNLGPQGKLDDAVNGFGRLVQGIAALPDLLVRAERIAAQVELMTVDGFPISKESLRSVETARSRGSLWMTLALWVIAALLAVLIYLR
ncbi:2-polyprenylphenol 6-hydroxylase [Flaviflagellibacter deserti]|uniref:2-polyprenylphenol 6-hydroxylase n=1 Tax=Flaviflagellibacter deserti TaxID=2267266 RepID=A0ABV9Z4R6_9HYPH